MASIGFQDSAQMRLAQDDKLHGNVTVTWIALRFVAD
jgi:hypothetical protein